MKKKLQDITFSNDFIFGQVLSRNQELAKKLAEIITGRKIRSITLPEDQHSIKLTYDGRGVRFDVYFEDDTNTKYDMEMQTTYHKNLPKRSRYYQSMMDNKALIAGTDYELLPNSYVIFICQDDPFKSNPDKSGLVKYSFENICSENGEPLNDGAYKIFINASAKSTEVTSDLKEFVEYLNYGKVADGISKEIDTAVEDIKKDEEVVTMFYTLQDKIRDERAASYEEGRIESTIRTALKYNASAEQIIQDLVEDCGLTPDEARKRIEEYQKQNNG
jgi:predicted transposase/invertase (TIGR01784 family)